MCSLAVMNIGCIQYLTKVMTDDRDDIYITLISRRPWAKCGLFAAVALRPILCGLIAAFCLKILDRKVAKSPEAKELTAQNIGKI